MKKACALDYSIAGRGIDYLEVHHFHHLGGLYRPVLSLRPRCFNPAN
ncbi:MAG: hypothetical protein ACI97A_000698 [Planctomycetota bacterium]|jgi:hypothetical protein